MRFLLIAIICVMGLVIPVTADAKIMCGKDLNGDGLATLPNETADCKQGNTPQGTTDNLCPMDELPCETFGGTPLCPTDKTCTTTPIDCSPGVWNAATNKCVTPLVSTTSCSSGTLLNGKCWNPNTPPYHSAKSACSSGTLSGGNCWKAATYNVSYTTHRCYTGPLFYCNGNDGYAVNVPICPNNNNQGGISIHQGCGLISGRGNQLFTTHVWEYTTGTGGYYSCSAGWTKSGTQCYKVATYSPPYCDSPWTKSGTQCYKPPTTFSTCPNSSWIKGNTLCTKSVACPSGAVQDPSSGACKKCTSPHQCIDAGNGYACSPNRCVNDAVTPPTIVPGNNKYLRDNGTVTSAGQCVGQIYFLGGKPGFCRPPGVQTRFDNCCSPTLVPIAGNTLVGSMLQNCTNTDEVITNQKRNANKCHYVGQYCAEKWPFIGCVQQTKAYCCFPDDMSRTWHEVGRPSLKSFGSAGGWGAAQQPVCRGFTPEELEGMDMDKVSIALGDLMKTKGFSINPATITNKINNLNIPK